MAMMMPPAAAGNKALQELLDAMVAGSLPGWAMPLMAESDVGGMQMKEVSKHALPLLLAPLRKLSADDPKPSLMGLADIVGLPGGPAAIGELLVAELTFLRTLWNGRQLQRSSWLGSLLSVGVPMIAGGKRDPNAPKCNLERLLEAGEIGRAHV